MWGVGFVYYFASAGALTSVAGASRLPAGGVFWLSARALLDSAGGLFFLYLLTACTVSLVGRVMRRRRRRAAPTTAPAAGAGGVRT